MTQRNIIVYNNRYIRDTHGMKKKVNTYEKWCIYICVDKVTCPFISYPTLLIHIVSILDGRDILDT